MRRIMVWALGLSAIVVMASVSALPIGDGGGGLPGGGGGSTDIYVPPRVYTYNFNEINNVETNVPSLTTALMGDKYDPATGSISFTHTDLTLPGNFSLNVMAQRTLTDPDNWFKATLELGNWSLDLPHVRSSYLTKYAGNPSSQSRYPYWASNTACSSTLNNNPDFYGYIANTNYELNKRDYYNGDFVSIPGKGSSKIIMNGSLKTTNQFWKISCQYVNGVNSFEITTTDGTKYLFSHLFVRPSLKRVYMGASPMICSGGTCSFPPLDYEKTIYGNPEREPKTRMQKWNAFMMVTNITDRHGNTVDFTYNSSGRIASIQASDGRLITFPGSGSLITSMVANGRTWLYNYTAETSAEVAKLTSVTLPDGKSWQFSYPNPSNHPSSPTNFWNKHYIGEHTQQDPSNPSMCSGWAFGNLVTMTHPGGAEGEFWISERCMAQADIPKIESYNRYGQGGFFQNYEIPKQSLVWALQGKTLKLADGTEYNWDYRYSNNPGYFHGDSTTSNHDDLQPSGTSIMPTIPGVSNTKDINATYVINPDGTKDVSYFNRAYGEESGKQIYSAVFDSSNTIYQKQQYTYLDGTLQGASLNWTATYNNVNGQRHPYLKNMSTGPYATQTKFRTAFGDDRNQLNKLTETTVYGDTGGTSTYTTDNRVFNQYDVPTSISQISDTATRYIFLDYDHDATRWILNQPTTTKVNNVDNSGVAAMKQVTYYSKSHSLYPFMPYQEKWFSKTRKTHLSYHTATGKKGLPNIIELNADLSTSSGKRRVKFSNYKRGKPTRVQTNNRYGSGFMSMYAAIDDNGWVTSTTDFNGVMTHYGYHPMGEIQYVDLADDSSLNTSWRDRWFTWSTNSVGEPVRTTSTCTLNSSRSGCINSSLLTTTENYDSFYRLQQSTLSGSGITRYQHFDYDSNNQQVFASHMSNSVNEVNGITTEFDALGRKSRQLMSGMGEINTDYLSGNRMRVIDAENNSTITTYRAFDSPSFGQPLTIDSPDNVTTNLDYDYYGNVTAITQSGLGDSGQSISITERRAYDSNNNLCMSVRPDVGATATKLNLMGEPEWTAQGVSGVSQSNPSCLASEPTSLAVDYTMDNTGQVWQVNYPDSTPDVTHTLDNIGNLLTLLAGSVSQSYSYNNQNLLQSETVTIPGYGPSINIDYEYNSLLARESMTYPDGEQVSFYPNAFGAPTKVLGTDYDYANFVTYHGNGSVNTFDYGNGIKHTTLLNSTTQLPSRIQDMNGSTRMNYLSYTFDNNANIKSLTDGVNNAYSITNLNYDGLDRLISTAGNSGVGNSTMEYDSLGNITYFTNAARTLDYSYNYSTNRLSSISSWGSNPKSYGSLSYDARGNITNNSHFSMGYNLANQMTTANGNSYLYDGHNRRVKVNSNEFNAYSKDGQLLFREKAGVKTQYVYLGNRLVAKKKANTPVYIHTNVLGSSVVETKVNKSLDQPRTYYRDYGDTIGSTPDDVGYTGHLFDTDIGLNYMQARYYDPVIGRFYSNDPVGYTPKNPVMSFNRYLYVNNNPYKYKDPDGEFLIGAVIGAVFEIGVQLAVNGGDVEEIDWSDVAVSATVGAFAPGMLLTGKTVLKSAKAANKLTKQVKNARTQNRKQKLERRVKKHKGKIKDAIKVQGAFQAGKAIGKTVDDQIDKPDDQGVKKKKMTKRKKIN